MILLPWQNCYQNILEYSTFLIFLKELLLCDVSYIELFSRKI